MMEIFLVTLPGLEAHLAEEARDAGFSVTATEPGGVTCQGDWADAARANLMLRGTTRVLVRLASFRAMHLAQLHKRARKLDWATWLRPDVPVRVEAVCRASKIYHKKAAAERIARAITETVGAPVADTAEIVLKLRIEDDLATLSLDTSGAALHQRGIKTKMHKAPLRETLAALLLRACGHDGQEALYDPMCGAGTLPIEAAEIAAGLWPGRARGFAMDHLAVRLSRPEPPAARPVALRYFGSDRDSGAIAMARANADAAGVASMTRFEMHPVSDITAPDTAPGLVMVNPPYGGRVGNKKPLFGLYAALGARLQEQFAGWRVGLVTTDAGLAKVTGLPWGPPGPHIDHGGLKIRLWQTGPLPGTH